MFEKPIVTEGHLHDDDIVFHDYTQSLVTCIIICFIHGLNA